MVYTDGVHLVADTFRELHRFALVTLRLQRAWFQDHPRHPHYDLTTSRKLRWATDNGAEMVTSRDIVRISKQMVEGQ